MFYTYYVQKRWRDLFSVDFIQLTHVAIHARLLKSLGEYLYNYIAVCYVNVNQIRGMIH